jgi:hypothetical protein
MNVQKIGVFGMVFLTLYIHVECLTIFAKNSLRRGQTGTISIY